MQNEGVQNTVTFKPLTNRSSDKSAAFTLPEDGFVQLVPKGEAPNWLGEKRIIQVVDDRALELMLGRLANREAEEMLIDDDHFSRDSDKSTDALGWQPLAKDALVNRGGDLYGAPRWSTLGLDKITGGVKRFVSPEFNPSNLEHLGGNRYRVTELVGLALTNRPGFKRLQKPLTNRDADDGIDNPKQTTPMHKALLAAHLGITESALEALSEDALKNRLSDIKVKADKAVTLETELTTLKNSAADEFITAHDKVIPAETKVREHLKTTFLANREMAESLVAGFKAATKDDNRTDEQRRRAEKKPLHNREDARAPEGAGAEAETEKLHNRARAYRDKHRVTYEVALAAVRSEKAD
jgi:phage I-like protein